MDIETLEKNLNQGKVESIYLLYGEEIFLREQIVKKIKNIFGEMITGINYINLGEENIKNLISEAEIPAFGYSRKLIIARNTNIFKKEGKRKSDSQEKEIINKLSTYIKENIENIKDNVIIIFIEDEAEKNTLYDTISKNGIVCKFEEQKPVQIIKRLKQICNLYKVNVNESTLQYFIECCGTNMQELINEIRKLIEYEGENGTITKETVDLLSTKKIESIIFELTDNLGKKNIAEALKVLNNLLYSKEPLQKILITLYNHFKKLYLVKLANKYKKNVSDVLNLKANQMFLINKYNIQSKAFKEEELRNIMQQLIDLDYNYKIGKIDLNIGFEAILCTYV